MAPDPFAGPRSSRELLLQADGLRLPGDLVLPSGAEALVVFVHGSGSSRHSPRNRSVAARLQCAGLATLLFDLLTGAEEAFDRQSADLRFDIDLLAERTVAVLDGLAQQPALAGLPPGFPLGLFGASTGAAAALHAAAQRPGRVRTVVSRGGRPDLAAPILAQVHCPVLLIVGSRDREVLTLNRWAAERLGGPHRLEEVSGASHLFEEPGCLACAAELACRWFLEQLLPPAA